MNFEMVYATPTPWGLSLHPAKVFINPCLTPWKDTGNRMLFKLAPADIIAKPVQNDIIFEPP